MATVTHAATAIWTTTAGNKASNAFTPAANDLLVVIAPATGVATSAVTDNNADGQGAYTQADTDRTGFSTAGHLTVWVRNALVGSATSTTVTCTQTSSTGGGVDVFRVSGMTQTGSAAVRQSAGQSSGTSATTPAPVMGGAVLTGSAVIAAVCCGTNSTANFTPRTGYTEATDLGYNTPATGLETMFRSSGETGTTLTWGSAAPSTFASVAVELDTSATASVHPAMAAGAGAAKNVTAAITETSPALELSGFGTFAVIGSGDTINSVALAVNTFSSNTLMGPPAFELWDHSGTPAQIGTTQTGATSTATAHTDNFTFTGIAYSKLATLRVRIYAHNGTAPAGALQYVNWASLTVNYIPAAGVSVLARAATGTGAAQPLVVTTAASVTAAAATGTGAALSAAATSAASPAAALPSGTGTARNATASTTSSGTANAVAATGAGTAQNAAAAVAVSATAATGTGTARNPLAAVGVTAVLATGTGTAQNLVAAIGVNAAPATGTGTAQGLAAAVAVNAVLASGAGAALNAAASTTSSGTAAAVLASATGAALNAAATATAQVTATLASGTGAVLSPAAGPGVNAAAATGTGAALNATAATAASVTAVLAAGAGAAQGITASTSSSGTANAGLASGTGTAQNAAAATGAAAAAATGTGAALNATASTAAFTNASAVLATGTGTAPNAGLALAAIIPAAPATGTGTAGPATPGTGARAAAATGTGAAQGASHAAATGLASGTGTAQGAAAALAVTAQAAAATALAAALNATGRGVEPFTIGTLTAYDQPLTVLTAATTTGGPS